MFPRGIQSEVTVNFDWAESLKVPSAEKKALIATVFDSLDRGTESAANVSYIQDLAEQHKCVTCLVDQPINKIDVTFDTLKQHVEYLGYSARLYSVKTWSEMSLALVVDKGGEEIEDRSKEFRFPHLRTLGNAALTAALGLSAIGASVVLGNFVLNYSNLPGHLQDQAAMLALCPVFLFAGACFFGMRALASRRAEILHADVLKKTSPSASLFYFHAQPVVASQFGSVLPEGRNMYRKAAADRERPRD